VRNRECACDIRDDIISNWNSKGIYKITNLKNGKTYIGQSKCIGSRWWRGHITNLKRGKHDNPYLIRAWEKYGEENFSFEIVELIDDQEERDKKEEFYINKYKSYDKLNGYNISMSAKGTRGVKHTDEAKNKIRETHIGENSYLSTLTEKEVIEIKTHIKNKTMSVKKLSEIYNVKRSVISNIKNGHNWTHITIDGFVSDNTIYRNATLTDEQVVEVKNLLKNEFTHMFIAEKFNVSESYISGIHRGSIRKEVYVEGFETSKNVHKKLNENQVREIKKLLADGDMNNKEIALLYNVSNQTICDIKKGRKWLKVTIEADTSAK
jgi:group I intron endonuclease